MLAAVMAPIVLAAWRRAMKKNYFKYLTKFVPGILVSQRTNYSIALAVPSLSVVLLNDSKRSDLE